MKDLTREHISNKKGNYISIDIILYTLTSHCRVYILHNYYTSMQLTIATVYTCSVNFSSYFLTLVNYPLIFHYQCIVNYYSTLLLEKLQLQ